MEVLPNFHSSALLPHHHHFCVCWWGIFLPTLPTYLSGTAYKVERSSSSSRCFNWQTLPQASSRLENQKPRCTGRVGLISSISLLTGSEWIQGMSVNTELQWELRRKTWENQKQYFNCSRQAKISRFFVHSHKFSPLLRAAEVSSKCLLCSSYRSVLFRLGESWSFRKVSALATDKSTASGESITSWGHHLPSEAGRGHSPSARLLPPGKKPFKFQDSLVC